MENSTNRKRCELCHQLKNPEEFPQNTLRRGGSKYCYSCHGVGNNKVQLGEKHLILREVFRHFEEFSSLYHRENIETLDYNGIQISYLLLQKVLEQADLSDRKSQAFVLNVLQDMTQKEVGAIMGICCVSVGQYVDSACRRLADLYFLMEEWEIVEKNLDKYPIKDASPDLELVT